MAISFTYARKHETNATLVLPPFFNDTWQELEDSPSVMLVHGNTGRSWHVNIKQKGGEFKVCEGWQQFAEDTDMGDNDLFSVQYCNNTFFIQTIAANDGQYNDIPMDLTNRETEPDSDHLVAAEWIILSSHWPSFRVTIDEWSSRTRAILLPQEFTKRYFKRVVLGVKDATEIVLQEVTASWNVTLHRLMPSRREKLFWLQEGVQKFMEDNDIQEGDICVFEYTSAFPMRLDVRVVKA